MNLLNEQKKNTRIAGCSWKSLLFLFAHLQTFRIFKWKVWTDVLPKDSSSLLRGTKSQFRWTETVLHSAAEWMVIDGRVAVARRPERKPRLSRYASLQNKNEEKNQRNGRVEKNRGARRNDKDGGAAEDTWAGKKDDFRGTGKERKKGEEEARRKGRGQGKKERNGRTRVCNNRRYPSTVLDPWSQCSIW